MPSSNPTLDDYRAALDALRARARTASDTTILEHFRREPQRLTRFCVQAAGLHVDLSKQRISQDDLDALLALAVAAGVPARRDAQFAGEPVNRTEGRAVLHTALRRDPSRPLPVDGRDLMPTVAQSLARMRAFATAVRDEQWRGAGGRPIRDVVNIGIGGSQLGPLLACEALRARAHPRLRVHFLANVDPGAWDAIRAQLDPQSTLAIIASKSWRTIETARNAEAVRDWLRAAGISHEGLARHLVGVTANVEGARAFGLADEAIFPFWDWVGGRFSLWSAIGLPVMLQVGAEGFDELLAGARALDEHFASAPLERNAPVLLALVSAWNRLALEGASEPVIPYCDALARLPAYLQQLQMESNGKSVDIDGHPVPLQTIPVVWGEPGTDAQHSFFQALHQGTTVHPVEFLVTIPQRPDPQGRDVALLANALAQAEALMRGRDLQASLAELLAGGTDPAQARSIAPHRVHSGNRPSTTILLESLTPYALGALIALYEHKTATLGWLWRINSFDQWGVELGKQLATRTEAVLTGEIPPADDTDPSTLDMIARVRALMAGRGPSG